MAKYKPLPAQNIAGPSSGAREQRKQVLEDVSRGATRRPSYWGVPREKQRNKASSTATPIKIESTEKARGQFKPLTIERQSNAEQQGE